MTRPDFDQWVEVHCACFPSVGTWLAGMWEQRRVDTLTNWWRQLQNVTLDDAAAASRAMADEEALQPIGFGNHGISVRNLARGYEKERRPKPPEDTEIAPAREPTEHDKEVLGKMCKDVRQAIRTGNWSDLVDESGEAI